MKQKLFALLTAVCMAFTFVPAAMLTVSAEGDPAIVRAYTENGNTVAELENTAGGVLIAAKYINGKLESVKYKDATNDTVIIEGIEASRVFLWDSLEGMKPLCSAFPIEADIDPGETQIPGETQTPGETQKPDETQKPGETQTPVETQTPIPTPTATPKPKPTFDPSLTAVTGDIVVHNVKNDGEYLDLSKVSLTFTANDDSALTYTAIIDGNSYDIGLTPGHTYTITASDNDGYALSELSGSYTLSANGTASSKNILFTETVSDIPFSATVKVGAKKEYATISDAITAIKAMKNRPAGENGRVTVEIDQGTYREQVIVDANYVTMKAADENKKPTITFYYGIGYIYYSAGDKGYYSEDYAVAKIRKSKVDRWGCVVRVTGMNFIAENIIFENSFNCNIVPEELADGVEAAGEGVYSDVKNKPDRTVSGYDPRTKDSATERAAAFAGDGRNYELYQCEFISSQDTLYTGYNGYFKNCYIEGGTDYIFGGNSVVFDGCTLAWHGYSDKATGGYITACKSGGVPTAGVPDLNANGYLLSNCTVANSKYYKDNKFAAGSWGRNWGGANCQVVFDDVTIANGVEVPGAWSKMGGELNTSILYVNNVHRADGTVIASTSNSFNPNGTMAAKDYTVMHMTDYFGPDWIPVHYTGGIKEKTEYTTTWYFGHSNGAPDYNYEGSGQTVDIKGTTDSETEQILHVDASNGKFNNINRDDDLCQVNNGTTFTIPVVNGSVITFDGYYETGTLTINGKAFKDTESYTYEGEAGTVVATANGVGWMSYIRVVSPITPAEPAVPAETLYKLDLSDTPTGNIADGGDVAGLTASLKTGVEGDISVADTDYGKAIEIKDTAANQNSLIWTADSPISEGRVSATVKFVSKNNSKNADIGFNKINGGNLYFQTKVGGKKTKFYIDKGVKDEQLTLSKDIEYTLVTDINYDKNTADMTLYNASGAVVTSASMSDVENHGITSLASEWAVKSITIALTAGGNTSGTEDDNIDLLITDYKVEYWSSGGAEEPKATDEPKATEEPAPTDDPNELRAFPEAEGGGKYTKGARGADNIEVYHVTSLADDGTGSLRDAVSKGGRIIVFDVGGIIELKKQLNIKDVDNLTILGQTAPGDGITITGSDVLLSNANNIIMRYLRIRPTDSQGGEPDGLGGRWVHDIVLDHCSVSWGVDELLTLYAGSLEDKLNDPIKYANRDPSKNITVQNCISAESLRMSNHFKGAHGYGGIIGATNGTYHHNLFAHHDSRNPRVDRNIQGTDMVNNVIYDWGNNSCYGAEPYSYNSKIATPEYVSRINIRNNYYKYGPSTKESIRSKIFEATNDDKNLKSDIYINGNYVYGNNAATSNNTSDEKYVKNRDKMNLLTSPIDMGVYEIPTQTAEAAFNDVMANVGATLPKRDSIDARIVADVQNGTGRIINSIEEVGGFEGITESNLTFEIPSEWKTANNMGSAKETDIVADGKWAGYTWIEAYVNDWTQGQSAPTNPDITVTAPAIANTARDSKYGSDGFWQVAKEGENVKYTAKATPKSGTSITKIELYDGTTLIKTVEAADINENITLEAGTHYLTCKAYNNKGEITTSPTSIVYVIKDANPNSSFTLKEIGKTAFPNNSGIWEKDGITYIGGSGLIGGTSDAFTYWSNPVNGNFTFSVKVESIPKYENGAYCGIMFRESLDADSRMVMLSDGWRKYGENIMAPRRTAKGGTLTDGWLKDASGKEVKNEGSYDTSDASKNLALPSYLKVERKDDKLILSVSNDGDNWTNNIRQPLEIDISDWSQDAYIGLAIDSIHGSSSEAAPMLPWYSIGSFSDIKLN